MGTRELNWGTQSSVALEYANKMYEGLSEKLRETTVAFRKCLAKAADAEWVRGHQGSFAAVRGFLEPLEAAG